MQPARPLPGADFWRRDPDPEPPPSPAGPRPATSPEDDARLAAVIERQWNSQSLRGRRWMSAIILLEQFETQPAPADLFADIDPEIAADRALPCPCPRMPNQIGEVMRLNPHWAQTRSLSLRQVIGLVPMPMAPAA